MASEAMRPAHVTRTRIRTLVITGPDGAGKTTMSDEIGAIITQAGRVPVRWHLRPGIVVGKTVGADVTSPHATTSRSLIASLVKLTLVWVDTFVGDVLARLRADPGIVTIVERGWYDMAVDPVRYRLHPGARRLVMLLGRLLPRADAVVVLVGDSQQMHRRKPELSADEVERQLTAWKRLAARVGRQAVFADATSNDSRALARQTWSAIRYRHPATAVWRRMPFTSRRVSMTWVGDPEVALQFHRSFRAAARALAPARRAAMRRALGRRVVAPIALAALCADLALEADAAAVMRSSTPGRHVVGLGQDGVLTHVLKVSGPDDQPLQVEAETLLGLAGHRTGFTVPRVTRTGWWDGRFVVAMEAAAVARDVIADLHTVEQICTSLVTGETALGPLVHGDLAPWNIIGTPGLPVLIDWERSQLGRFPLLDLAHYVIACGAHLGRYRPAEVRALMCDPGGPGWTHLRNVGEDPATAAALLRAYTEDQLTGSGRRVGQFWHLVAFGG